MCQKKALKGTKEMVYNVCVSGRVMLAFFGLGWWLFLDVPVG